MSQLISVEVQKPRQVLAMVLDDASLVNLEALAAGLGLTTTSAKNWCAKHGVRPLTQGRTWLFSGRSIRLQLEAQNQLDISPPRSRSKPAASEPYRSPYPAVGSGGPYHVVMGAGALTVGIEMERDEAMKYADELFDRLPAKECVDIVSKEEKFQYCRKKAPLIG